MLEDESEELLIDEDRHEQGDIWLIPLKVLDDDARAIQLGAVAELTVEARQREFVGDPLRMMLISLEEESRLPYVIESGGAAVGVFTLQSGAAKLAGWPDDDSVWLLRGFLIDSGSQGRGLGTLAARAAVEEARKLTARLGGGQAGVVLSVNERNPAGIAAYSKAGFVDSGRYLGGNAGPQRTMYKAFPADRVISIQQDPDVN
ncbi:GNAT family N-acetyltransferase [Paenarthrobacter sp. NPDC090517]|uniref:GNAT family N-acetyltransferase n=1 Tax=Paenarthrobacter sp. NPDC090517 TaxID=3364381 RepID=UPI0038158CE2